MNVVKSEVSMEGASMGTDKNNNPVWIRSGRFGKYLEIGRRENKTLKRYGLPKWLPVTVTLQELLEFASLPRIIGMHPDPLLKSAAVIVEISSGSVCVGVEGYPLRIPLSKEGVYLSDVSFDDALILFPEPQVILASCTLLGLMNDTPVTIEKSRWGAYLRCGDTVSQAPKIAKELITLEKL